MSAGSIVPGRRLHSRSGLCLLGPEDHDEIVELLELSPELDVLVASRVLSWRLRPGSLGGELWGYRDGGRLTSLCYAGANLVPVRADGGAAIAFAERAAARPRRCSSIVGRATDVLAMWSILRPAWGRAREVRPDQPVMVIGSTPQVAPDPAVRHVTPAELDVLMPAAVAMFTEEVGVSPLRPDGGSYYRARLNELIRAGRSFARIEDGQVVFKAEVGAASATACQVQGVWVTPERRGEGLAAPGMAAVVELARRHIAPQVSLYVNAFNTAGLATYRRVGFTQAGTFATVLF